MHIRNRNWRREQRASAIDRARIRARSAGITSENWIHRSAVTPHPCSRWCCGNPRAHGGGGRVGEDAPRVEEDWG